jgi:hypothetical protein
VRTIISAPRLQNAVNHTTAGPLSLSGNGTLVAKWNSNLHLQYRTDGERQDIIQTEISWLEDITGDKRRQFQKSTKAQCTLNQEMLWLLRGNSSGNQKRELPPLETSTRGLVKYSRLKRQSACYAELSSVRNGVTLWIIIEKRTSSVRNQCQRTGKIQQTEKTKCMLCWTLECEK